VSIERCVPIPEAAERRFVPQQTGPLFDRRVSGFGVARMMRALCKKKPGTPPT
jgi:hypothetical protein